MTLCTWCLKPITTYGLDTGREPGGSTMWTHELGDGEYRLHCVDTDGVPSQMTAEPVS